MKVLKLNIQLFASANASQTIYSKGSSKYGYDISVSWEEQSGYDAEKNTTTIKGYASLYGKNVSFSTSTGGTLYFDWYDNKTKTWTNKASKTITTTARGTTYKAEATFSVEHNADGTLKGKARVRWDKTGTNQWIPNDGSKETSEQTLTTIPRATKIGDHSGTIGTEMKFTWNRNSTSFTHTLKIAFGGKEYTVSGGENAYWTPPNEIYSVMPGKNGKGTLTLTTYSGNTPVGSAQTAEITLYADESKVNPVPDGDGVFDTNDATIALTGDSLKIVTHKSLVLYDLDFYTRGYTKISTATVNGVSATIQNVGVDQKDSSKTHYNIAVDIGTITSNTINVVLTDARGYTKLHTFTIPADRFIQYTPLSISPTFKRIAPTTGEVGMTFTGNYFNGSFGKQSNNLTISYKYKKKDDTTYSDLITLVENTDYKISGNTYYSGSGTSADVVQLDALFDYKSLYEIQLFVSDKITTHPIIIATITKGIPIFWWSGDKVVINGELHIANVEGKDDINIEDKFVDVSQSVSTSTTDVPSCNAVYNRMLSGIPVFEPMYDGVYERLLASVTFTSTYQREVLVLAIGHSGYSSTDQSGIAIICPACAESTTNTATQYAPITIMGDLETSDFNIVKSGNRIDIYFKKNGHYRTYYAFCLAKTDGVTLY